MTSPLSPEAVAQMVADREAGTPGPWTVSPSFNKPRIHADGWIVAQASGERNAANASRIARLPDLEAAYLSLVAQNATLQHDLDMKEIACDMLNTAWDQSIAENATLRASEAAALERITELEAATQLALDTADMSNNTRAALLGALNSGVGLTPTADKEPTT